jgi:hypothetical protein
MARQADGIGYVTEMPSARSQARVAYCTQERILHRNCGTWDFVNDVRIERAAPGNLRLSVKCPP